MSTITVRAFEERDAAPACALVNHYIEKTPVHFGLQPETPDQFRAAWIEGHSRYPWVAAEFDGSFAGYAKCAQWRTRDAYALTAETGIYVSHHAQGRGVGRALYLDLIRRAREMNFHLLVAGATLPNDASVRLHESVGFQRVGIFTECGRKFDRWHDVIFWQLRL